jgi:hypothetical protein
MSLILSLCRADPSFCSGTVHTCTEKIIPDQSHLTLAIRGDRHAMIHLYLLPEDKDEPTEDTTIQRAILWNSKTNERVVLGEIG